MFWIRRLNGTSGVDNLVATRDDQAVFGRGGDDQLFSGFNRTLLDGGDGDDALRTEVSVDRTGGSGSNAALAIAAFLGGRGNDTLTGSLAARSKGDAAASNAADGGAGNDTIDMTALVGTSGGGRLAASNLIRAGDGLNVILAQAVTDYTINYQSETYDYAGLPASVHLSNIIFGGADADNIVAQTTNNVPENVDPFRSTYVNAIAAGGGDDTVQVNGEAYTGLSSRFRTLLDGGDGNDVLGAYLVGYSSGRIDALNQFKGGDGDDSLNVNVSFPGGAVINVVTRLSGGSGNDVIENRILTGADASGSTEQWFSGGAGDDVVQTGVTFRGGGLEGFFHSDHLSGGDGDDVLNAGASIFTDRAGYYPTSGPMHIRFDLSGGEGNDRLAAGSAIQTLPESDLYIRISGGNGNDVLAAGYSGLGTIGNWLMGGAGDDRVTVNTTMTMTDYNYPYERVLSNGTSHLDGGTGNDTVGGWAGTILATGGAGVDSFIFDPAIESEMRIADFDLLTERILFSIRQHDPWQYRADPSETWEDAAITSIDDAGFGADVTISFISGARLILEGIGTGSIDDISGFVDYEVAEAW